MHNILLSTSTPPSTTIIIASENIKTAYAILGIVYSSTANDVSSTIELYISFDTETNLALPISGTKILPGPNSVGSVYPTVFANRVQTFMIQRTVNSVFKLKHINNSASKIAVTVNIEIAELSQKDIEELL